MSINVAASAGAISGEKNMDDGIINNSTFVRGEKVLVRTVTYAFTARVIGLSQVGQTTFLHLEESCFVAVTDRFFDGLRKGTAQEHEPIPGLYRVNIASIVDICQWTHKLLDFQK